MGVQTCVFSFSMTQIVIIFPSFSVVQSSWASNPGRLRVGVGGGNSFQIFVATNVAMQHNILEDWGPSTTSSFFFYVLLTVHLSMFILVINQFDAQNLFYNMFISCLYMFGAPCAHCQEVKIVLYSLWYHHTYRWLSRAQPVHWTATYRCDDIRGCIIQFWPPDDEHMWSKHVEVWNKLIIKFSASSWLILR